MKKADSSGAAYAVIIGEDELQAGLVQLKDLRGTGGQVPVSFDNLLEAVIDCLVLGSEE